MKGFEMRVPVKKVVLAYSGGLDTSVIIPWLKETYGCEVIAMAADVGQGEELKPLRAKAIATGASKIYIEDLRKEFVTDFLWPMLRSGAVYEGQYLLGTSIARPLIAKRLVEIALKEGADAIAHGATGKGNDQVRFELTVKALAPQLRIIAPWREWDLASREDCIRYAEARKIPLTVSRKKPYSEDRNLWHISHEGGILEDPSKECPESVYTMTVDPAKAPAAGLLVRLDFERGLPVALDGKRMDPLNLILKLNVLGGRHGVGRVDLTENRLVGMKSRGIYETPGGSILIEAHRVLETLTLDKETARVKASLAQKYADLVYNGQWYTPLRQALDSFVDRTQATASGWVKLRLQRGAIRLAGVSSPHSLYNNDLASFDTGSYRHQDAEGFINLFGLPMTVEKRFRLGRGGKAKGK
ncbi:MAG TPA: argininosuccinate synthase [bacterium]|nr:argininosuccinate synthase [bacterium]